MSLPILPLDALTPELDEELVAQAERDPFGPGTGATHAGPSGRWLLGAWLATVVSDRTQEIALLTTSDETYISTCVTVAAFNWGRVSRVVTPDTVAVVVIHEFGYRFGDLGARCAEWRSRGIAVLEDCAHLVGPTPGGPVGVDGDAALYSLPKSVPAPAGGLLRTTGPLALPAMDAAEAERTAQGRAAAERYLGRTWWLNERRLRRHRRLAAGCPVVELSADAIPWATAVRVADRRRTEAEVVGVEWVATLRPDRVMVPTNPCVAEPAFTRLAEELAGRGADVTGGPG